MSPQGADKVGFMQAVAMIIVAVASLIGAIALLAMAIKAIKS